MASETRRTGWTTSHRRCPVHGQDLELTFDETDYSAWVAPAGFPAANPMFRHDDNRILWRCNLCVGSWTENHFLYGILPVPPHERFLVSCPKCGSRRVTHTCVPECCDSHECLDCGAELTPEVELLEPGAPSRSPGLRSIDVAVSASYAPLARSGSTRAFRRCERDGCELELVIVDLNEGAEPDPLPAVAWACAKCDRWWAESCFRALRRCFVDEATPAVVCPTCRSSRMTPHEKGAKCGDCGAVLSVRLVC